MAYTKLDARVKQFNAQLLGAKRRLVRCEQERNETMLEIKDLIADLRILGVEAKGPLYLGDLTYEDVFDIDTIARPPQEQSQVESSSGSGLELDDPDSKQTEIQDDPVDDEVKAPVAASKEDRRIPQCDDTGAVDWETLVSEVFAMFEGQADFETILTSLNAYVRSFRGWYLGSEQIEAGAIRVIGSWIPNGKAVKGDHDLITLDEASPSSAIPHTEAQWSLAVRDPQIDVGNPARHERRVVEALRVGVGQWMIGDRMPLQVVRANVHRAIIGGVGRP